MSATESPPIDPPTCSQAGILPDLLQDLNLADGRPKREARRPQWTSQPRPTDSCPHPVAAISAQIQSRQSANVDVTNLMVNGVCEREPTRVVHRCPAGSVAGWR